LQIIHTLFRVGISSDKSLKAVCLFFSFQPSTSSGSTGSCHFPDVVGGGGVGGGGAGGGGGVGGVGVGGKSHPIAKASLHATTSSSIIAPTPLSSQLTCAPPSAVATTPAVVLPMTTSKFSLFGKKGKSTS